MTGSEKSKEPIEGYIGSLDTIELGIYSALFLLVPVQRRAVGVNGLDGSRVRLPQVPSQILLLSLLPVTVHREGPFLIVHDETNFLGGCSQGGGGAT